MMVLGRVAAEAVEQARAETWIMREVKGGAAFAGLYPTDAGTRARFDAAEGPGRRYAGHRGAKSAGVYRLLAWAGYHTATG